MNLPGWHYHPLQGQSAGRYAVMVNGNWRLTYAFDNGDAILIDYEDSNEETAMIGMHNPPHPGEVLADTVLSDGGINVTEFAKRLKVTRTAISRIVNGHAAISTDMAIRLESALGTSAETWLGMQTAYDLWQAKRHSRVKIAKIEMHEA